MIHLQGIKYATINDVIENGPYISCITYVLFEYERAYKNLPVDQIRRFFHIPNDFGPFLLKCAGLYMLGFRLSPENYRTGHGVKLGYTGTDVKHIKVTAYLVLLLTIVYSLRDLKNQNDFKLNLKSITHKPILTQNVFWTVSTDLLSV